MQKHMNFNNLNINPLNISINSYQIILEFLEI